MAEPTPLLKPLAPATLAPHLWKQGAFADDAWQIITDDAPPPLGGCGIVLPAVNRVYQGASLDHGGHWQRRRA